MAVVQISRIQVRRGRANSGTGIPQLASGEMAWALDTQQLYIGNGSVAEGAPAVGNTKILTENDLTAQGNILDLIQHIYKVDDPTIQTGASATTPVTRTLQNRLDDYVNVRSFGAMGDGTTDDTAAIQRAISELFLNPTTKASSDTPDGTATRVVLQIPPGIFNISSTLYLPSYASLIGSGAEKTIINFTGTTGPVIQFVNDQSYITDTISKDEVTVVSSSDSQSQPRFINVSNLTINTNSETVTGMQLDNVKHSFFENLRFEGQFSGIYNANSNGIIMTAFSGYELDDGISSSNNIFENITLVGFSRAVYAKQDIRNNSFNNCYVTNCQVGFSLGDGANGSSAGEQYGPRETLITNCRFYNIMRQAVFIDRGQNNSLSNLKLVNVGNDGGGHVSAQYPQIYFKNPGNSVDNIYSDRSSDMANPAPNIVAVPYIPEVAGQVSYTSFSSRKVAIGQITNAALCFRLPISTDQFGAPTRGIGYKIDYVYRSVNNNFARHGSLVVSASVDPGLAQLTDEYNFLGTDSAVSLTLDFQVKLLDATGNTYTGALGQVPSSIAINYTNSLVGDVGVLEYSYTSIS